MLETLHIENIALIRSLEMDFRGGFQVLTGETGAGKSILIGAIGLLTGMKSDKTLIRTGESEAVVYGTFTVGTESATEHLRALDITPSEDGRVIVERHLYADGRGKIKVNGAPVTLTALKEISKYLIDIHGQNDTLSLYESAEYIRILDAFASLEDAYRQYSADYETYERLHREMAEINRSEAERIRHIEMLTYQIADIDTLHLKPGEDEALEEKEKRIKNRERIFKHASYAFRMLKGAEKGNAAMLVDRSAAAMDMITDAVPEAEALAKELRDCLYAIEDIAERAYAMTESEDGDPTAMINKIEARLDAINKLKKKYGSTVEEILTYRENAAKRLAQYQNADDRLIELRELCATATAEAEKSAAVLHERRLHAAENLAKRVIETLVFLDMPKVTFRIDVTENVNADGAHILTYAGYDTVDFLISANSGEELHSLSRVASGGELARMMLALKCAEGHTRTATAMIFDEIDAGVSGKTARKIGLKLLELSRDTQVFCVTHSAQIASLADEHYLIAKHEEGGRTVTGLTALDEDGRIRELSRVLGGIHVTDAQRQAAVDMRREKLNIQN